MRPSWCVAGCALLISGCVSLPEFDTSRGVTPKSVVAVIECELIRVRNKIDAENKLKRDTGEAKNKALEDLHGWIAVAELALQVDEQAVLTPSLSHVGAATKSFASVFDWGAKLDTQSQRIYNQTVTFNVTDLRERCTSETIGTGVALHGSLGLDEVLHMAFESANAKGISLGRQEDGDDDDAGDRGSGSGGGKKKVKKKKKPGGRSQSAFGTTIEFAVVKAIGPGGPTWTLSNFKGTGKLLTVQRSDVHRVQISFARDEEAAKRFNESSALQNLTTKRLAPTF
jgi:hypothetical protein